LNLPQFGWLNFLLHQKSPQCDEMLQKLLSTILLMVPKSCTSWYGKSPVIYPRFHSCQVVVWDVFQQRALKLDKTRSSEIGNSHPQCVNTVIYQRFSVLLIKDGRWWKISVFPNWISQSPVGLLSNGSFWSLLGRQNSHEPFCRNFSNFEMMWTVGFSPLHRSI